MAGTAAGSGQFAEKLCALKERSGLSYGQLANRLHVSTSTLHRYCHGDAVPADYAVVERLARLCGAGPEELVELHRRWVLADAARRAGNRGGGTEPAAAEVREAPGEVSGATEAAEAVPEPVVEGPPPVTGATARRGSWRGRLSRPALAIPVAALVLTGAALAMTDATGDGGAKAARIAPSATGGTGSASAPAATPEEQRSGSPTARPSTSGTPAAPSVSPSSGGPSRSPSGKGSGTGSTPAAAAKPLTWSVRSHVWENGCDHRYLIDRPSSDVPPPPVAQDAPAWATALDAVHGGTTIVEATVRGRTTAPVVVQALHVRVVERRGPLRWSSYAMDNGCGGALTPATYAVDLDVPRPLARPRDGFDGENTVPAVRLPYQVTDKDPLVLRVDARTQGCDCDWYLEADWTSGGHKGTLRITDGGRPFRTSGVKGRPEYGYWPATGWTRN
ncbi:helix-turn-helix domain-containing protein [Streptomyces sp. NPDC058691]|uniref:helix-turn-helix domain-containing protein n=1 Tax=Streptomyces sp. NPDC058691 TaxID=3346601 RepID=UPI00365CD48B